MEKKAKTKQERYVDAQWEIKGRAIFKILTTQKNTIADLLEQFSASKAVQTSLPIDDIVSDQVYKMAWGVPEYLYRVLPEIMLVWAKGNIKKYKKYLPKKYRLRFDIPTEPAVEYLRGVYDLMLSKRRGSIAFTTEQEVLKIIRAWVGEGMSYGQIAKQIRETNPYVFSKERAKLIAVNEIGKAYGWANHQPWVQMVRDGYIMEKQWVTSHDDKVRASHTANESAGWIPFGNEFPGTGDQYAPSSRQIRCRCTSTDRIVGIVNKWVTYLHMPHGIAHGNDQKKCVAIHGNSQDFHKFLANLEKAKSSI